MPTLKQHSFNSALADGTPVKVTLTKTKPSEGTIQTIESRGRRKPKVSTVRLYNIQSTAKGIRGKADVPFRDPDVNIELKTGIVDVKIANGMGAGRMAYPLGMDEVDRLRDFLALCKFPVA